MNRNGLINGVFSFLLVLLLMPIGHAIMVLNEIWLNEYKLLGAGIMGCIGVVMLYLGVKKNTKATLATLLGFLGGILVWTGWIEFSFVWIAEKNNVAPQLFEGEVSTKPEYLVMLSSVGLLATITLFYLFARSNCLFFIWFQKVLRLRKDVFVQTGYKKPLALVAFSETIMIIWFFYVVLLLVYDDQIAGDTHPITHFVAWGSFIWSIFLISNLLRIKNFDYAVRYAVPTVIIFWNFVEVLGRWGLFKEIWVHPQEYWFEVSMFFLLLAALLYLFLTNPFFKNRKRYYES